MGCCIEGMEGSQVLLKSELGPRLGFALLYTTSTTARAERVLSENKTDGHDSEVLNGVLRTVVVDIHLPAFEVN
jgi:hypothetical protein